MATVKENILQRGSGECRLTAPTKRKEFLERRLAGGRIGLKSNL